jgi:hypothetical protein
VSRWKEGWQKETMETSELKWRGKNIKKVEEIMDRVGGGGDVLLVSPDRLV